MAPDLVPTRRTLHGLAEALLAGPQYRVSGTIRLRVTDDGAATVAAPALTLTPTHLVTAVEILPLNGTTCRALAASAGIEPGAPLGLYADHADLTLDETLQVDPEAASVLLTALQRGDAALRRLEAGTTPVLWPEHFDVAVTVDEVNFGVSPGDDYLPQPYAYVGPWTPQRGEFWNAPFGAARPLADLPGRALDDFFAEGRRLAAT